MMGRGRDITLGHWFQFPTDAVDEEHYAELDIYVTDPIPETQWEPGDPGWIQQLALRIDHEDVDLADYPALVEQILATEEIPEREKVWG